MQVKISNWKFIKSGQNTLSVLEIQNTFKNVCQINTQTFLIRMRIQRCYNWDMLEMLIFIVIINFRLGIY